MLSSTLIPRSFEERLIWWTLLATYPCYLAGALYLVGPVLGWSLLLIWLLRCCVSAKAQQPVLALPSLLWLVGMLGMLLALYIGHLSFSLSTVQIIKSTLGWFKGWALLAVFVLVGAASIRFELLVRACMILCLHTCLLIPLFIAAWLFGLPQTLYTSPLQVIGGPGPEFFSLSLYEIDPGSGLPRWRLFTPYAPALGLLANVFFILALEEKQRFWRWCGLCCAVLLILMSQSRLAIICCLLLCAIRFQLCYLRGAKLYFMLALAMLFIGFFGPALFDVLEQTHQTIREARADSTRVREALARLAIHRWQTEAVFWGHGTVERGPHLVEYMPIGSHHTWYGLLFIKGVAGVISLLLPLFTSLVICARYSRKQVESRAAFLCLLTLSLYTLGENIEMLAYLYWPALITVGLAHKLQFQAYCQQMLVKCNKLSC